MQASEPISLEQWFAELDQHHERIPLESLNSGLKRLRLDLECLKPFIQFSSDRYRRNLMHAGPAYHALVLCWRSGQRSPIHDHRGSSCAVKIVRGEATETVFSMTAEGHVYPVRTRTLAEGFTCATQDMDIHQISNLQPRHQDLVTLHIYSPPLLVMGQYSLTDTQVRDFEDAVHAFTEGAGI
jgi:cysteine dioxygenase